MNPKEKVPGVPDNHLESGKKETEPHVCVFCEIVADRISSEKIAETEKSISFMSLEGHPLVISKTHIGEKIEEDLDSVSDTFRLSAALSPHVKSVYRATGINLVSNIGKSAGQEVMHFHIHMIPRHENDRQLKLNNLNIYGKDEIRDMSAKLRNVFPDFLDKI